MEKFPIVDLAWIKKIQRERWEMEMGRSWFKGKLYLSFNIRKTYSGKEQEWIVW